MAGQSDDYGVFFGNNGKIPELKSKTCSNGGYPTGKPYCVGGTLSNGRSYPDKLYYLLK